MHSTRLIVEFDRTNLTTMSLLFANNTNKKNHIILINGFKEILKFEKI